VVKKKLAIDAGANYDGYARDDGSFSVYAIPRPGVTLENLERAVDGVIAGLFSREAAAADLERAKTQLIASATYRRDSQYALASAYGQALSIGLTANDVEQWPDRIRAVTAETVRKAAIKDLKKIEAVSGYLRPGK
jgi:zinc protease